MEFSFLKTFYLFYLNNLLIKGNLATDENIIRQFLHIGSYRQAVIFSCGWIKDDIKLEQKLFLNDVKVFVYNSNNIMITIQQVQLSWPFHQTAVILDATCKGANELLSYGDSRQYFHEIFHWLIFVDNLDTAKMLLRDKEININANILLSIKEKFHQVFVDCYNPASLHGGSLTFTKIGNSNNISRLNLIHLNNKYLMRKNLSGVTFKSAVVIPFNTTTPVMEYVLNEDDRKNNTFSRFQNVVTWNCRDFFNFSMILSVENSWGYLKSNGEFDGLVRSLQERKLDFGCAPLFFTKPRARVIDYGYGTWIINSVFIFRHPKTTASSKEIYFRPLATSVWILIFFSLILIILVLRHAYLSDYKLLKENYEYSWSYVIVCSIGVLCLQGVNNTSRLIGNKVATFSALIFSFLIYQFYSASIVSYLLMEPPRTITKLEDLLESYLKTGCDDNLFDRNFLNTTSDPIVRKLYNKKLRGQFFDAEMGIRKVKEENFAFHSQTSVAYPIIERTYSQREICDLQEVRMYRIQPLYISLQKRSPFRKMFNYCMVRQAELGVLNRLRKFWDARKPQCIRTSGSTLEIEVGLKESYWVLLVLLGGMVISLIILWCEVLSARKNKSMTLRLKCKKEKRTKKKWYSLRALY